MDGIKKNPFSCAFTVIAAGMTVKHDFRYFFALCSKSCDTIYGCRNVQVYNIVISFFQNTLYLALLSQRMS